jgi:tetratricopeptide (TPR) repeat protein
MYGIGGIIQMLGIRQTTKSSHTSSSLFLSRCHVLLLGVGLFAVRCSLLGQSDETEIQKYSQEGQQALAGGRYSDAEQAYEKLSKLQPELAEVHANLGLIYFQQRKFDQAALELRQALRLKPSLVRVESLLGMSLSELGQYSDALPGLQKGFRSPDPEIKRMSGLQLERAYTALKKDNKAVEVAMEMNRTYPKDPEVLYHNGRIFGNFAFLSVQKLAQVAPESVWTHQAAAEAYESQGTYNSAISEYRQVLAKEPRRPGVHYRLGRTLSARSRTTGSVPDRIEAIQEFEEELNLDPLNASAAYEIAEIHRNAGELEDAQKYFEHALKSYRDFEQAHLGLASVLTSLGKPTLALSHLQKAISLNGENEVSWYRLARVERALGNTEAAARAIARFQQLHEHKPLQEAEGKSLLSVEELNKQTVDSDASQ